MMFDLNDDSRKQKVIHVVNGLVFGGNENLCLQLIRHSPSNVENILWNLNDRRLGMLPLFQGIPNLKDIRHFYPFSRLKLLVTLTREFRRIRPDAILMYSFGVNHLIVGMAARLAGIRSYHVRTGNPAPVHGGMRAKIRIILWGSLLLKIPIQACSDYVLKSFKKIAPLSKGSGFIPNGCDVLGISGRSKKSRQERIFDGKWIVGMVARLNKIKDHRTLIEAFHRVLSKIPDAQLWLIGDGEERAPLEEFVSGKGLNGKVLFFGDRQDVPELLGQVDVYAFSTTPDEGFGIALIEAMAAGLPVVSTDVPSSREVLGQDEGGVLVPPRDPEALADILERWLLSEDERNLWGRKAYQHVLAHFDIRNCASQWYGRLLGAPLK